ncbi:hypothetical protein [Cohnella abietis]|uniref:DUF304 domain-containing protein n=1 Tax=Cohnella abietis TaxID=2507935 RepID=A0A3T1D765_9BACL|nr:hypothetical protein [Cohnella abietis]BBI33922.1 hypothetical protein KCTCHS21_33210 [Cohnella abietis]
MREIKHPIKSPARIGTIIGMIAIILSQFILVWKSSDHTGVFYISVTAIFLCLVVLLLALYRTFFKGPTELCLSNEQIILNGKIINSSDINVIMIRGYFRPVIGILPYKKRIVPMDMVFRYLKDEERGTSDLRNWATMNNVKMVNKSFQTWI